MRISIHSYQNKSEKASMKEFATASYEYYFKPLEKISSSKQGNYN